MLMTFMLRKVSLPEGISGQLYLHSMPSRYEDWDKFVSKVHFRGIDFIVCLASEGEIKKKSPVYAEARSNNTLTCQTRDFPIDDYSVPQPAVRSKFKKFIEMIAGDLRSGKNVLIHCGAGNGRTGTVSVCILLELGIGDVEAKYIVMRAGSHPEVPEQEDLVAWYSSA
jgi:protein-tyrosine phosphatase